MKKSKWQVEEKIISRTTFYRVYRNLGAQKTESKGLYIYRAEAEEIAAALNEEEERKHGRL